MGETPDSYKLVRSFCLFYLFCFVSSHSSTRRKYVTSTWKMRRLTKSSEMVCIIPPQFLFHKVSEVSALKALLLKDNSATELFFFQCPVMSCKPAEEIRAVTEKCGLERTSRGSVL